MKDVYLMNKATGEIEPATKVIKDFYKTHSYLDAWTDFWTETDIETETDLETPNFLLTIN